MKLASVPSEEDNLMMKGMFGDKNKPASEMKHRDDSG